MEPNLIVTDVIDEGNLGVKVGQTFEEILDTAVRALDKAYAHEISGNVIFKANNSKFYVAVTEISISEANLEFVADNLESMIDDFDCSCELAGEEGGHTAECEVHAYEKLLEEVQASLKENS